MATSKPPSKICRRRSGKRARMVRLAETQVVVAAGGRTELKHGHGALKATVAVNRD